ncbi:MAG: hypothetical protein ACXIUV_08885 [Alkalilacustris sp.]
MGHDWLFEVLADMKAYAERHGMADLSNKITEAEEVARREVARTDDSSGDPVSSKPARRG